MLFLALALLLLAENGYLLPVILPFAVAIAIQLIRAARLPGKEGLPKLNSATSSIRRWHVAAVVIVAATSSIWLLQRARSESLFEPSISCWLNLILLDLALVAVVATTVFVVLYLGKLQVLGHRHAEFLAFATLAIPMAVAWTAIQTFAAEIDSDWVTVDSSPFAIACGVLGLTAFVLALRFDSGRLKTWIMALASFLLLVSISGGNQPWNPLAIFAAVLVGYATYRIEWKRILASTDAATAHLGLERRMKLE